MATLCYIRVSTKEQNTARQEALLRGCDKMFIEKVSGKDTENRPVLKAMMEYAREGDTVKVESYSRFARSTRDLLNLMAELKAKRVSFISEKEKVDTSTPQGELMMNIFASLAQFEQDQITQRVREGVDAAKAAGKYKGRKPIQIDEVQFDNEVRQWKAGNQTAVQTMKNLGLKPNTFYRRVETLGFNEAIGMTVNSKSALLRERRAKEALSQGQGNTEIAEEAAGEVREKPTAPSTEDRGKDSTEIIMKAGIEGRTPSKQKG